MLLLRIHSYPASFIYLIKKGFKCICLLGAPSETSDEIGTIWRRLAWSKDDKHESGNGLKLSPSKEKSFLSNIFLHCTLPPW